MANPSRWHVTSLYRTHSITVSQHSAIDREIDACWAPVVRALAGCTADVVVMGGIGAAFSDSCVREPGGVGVEDGIWGKLHWQHCQATMSSMVAGCICVLLVLQTWIICGGSGGVLVGWAFPGYK